MFVDSEISDSLNCWVSSSNLSLSLADLISANRSDFSAASLAAMAAMDVSSLTLSLFSNSEVASFESSSSLRMDDTYGSQRISWYSAYDDDLGQVIFTYGYIMHQYFSMKDEYG